MRTVLAMSAEAYPRAESRAERKEHTRRAILDAALRLCEGSSLVALSLRAVAKEVGVVPTAFYRHFGSIEDLGLALVDESFMSLRAVLRDVRRHDPALSELIDTSIALLVEHVRAQRAHFGFIARERGAGPPAVREAISAQLGLFERELADDLARLPGVDAWAYEDLHALSSLFVTALVGTAVDLLQADHPQAEKQLVETARTQLRMVLFGAVNWRSEP